MAINQVVVKLSLDKAGIAASAERVTEMRKAAVDARAVRETAQADALPEGGSVGPEEKCFFVRERNRRSPHSHACTRSGMCVCHHVQSKPVA